MIGRGLEVPRARGEAARRALADAGFLRSDLEIVRGEETLVFPLAEGAPSTLPWGRVVEREFPPIAAPPPSDYRDLLSVRPEERAAYPRSFDVIGDVVLVRLADSLETQKGAIGEALLRFVPGARLVGLDRGVHGTERRRTVERLAGAGGWRTRHRENGLEIDVDVERAYFSPRLAREHERVASEIRVGDRVHDLCCGVGPFSLTIARDGRAARVTAVDSNPAAIELLRASMRRVPHGDRIEPVEARIESFVPTAEPRERVILNLPLEGIKYLPSVARTVAPGGRLYYYEVASRTDIERRSEEIVASLGTSGAWTVAERRTVHPYSPSSDLTAFVLERGGR